MGNNINTDLIKSYLHKNKLSKKHFCKLCRIGISTLNKILNNQRNFRINALFKISMVMNLQVYKLFK